jgi:hypothetical protein
MRHTHKIAKYIKMKQAGLGSLAFPSMGTINGSWSTEEVATERFTTLPFIEPSPGRAMRKPALKQAKTNRGHSIFGNVVVYHESGLEQRVSALLRTYRDVKRLVSQYPRVEYFDKDRTRREHTFDYSIELVDGTRIAIAVKPSRKREEMADLLERIRDNGIIGLGTGGRRTPNIVDAVMLATDTDATYELFENTYFILASRDHHDEAEAAHLHDIVRHLPGQFRFGSLLLNCPSRSKRRTAIWRLIDFGVLEPVVLGRIDELSWLRTKQ